jgi:hypothetical protein
VNGAAMAQPLRSICWQHLLKSRLWTKAWVNVSDIMNAYAVIITSTTIVCGKLCSMPEVS